LPLVNITNMEKLEFASGVTGVTLTSAQLAEFKTIVHQDGSGAAFSITAHDAGTYSLAGKTITGILTFTGSSGADTLIGSSGADILNGNDGEDSIDGGAGDDQILGGGGDDGLIGGNGNDTIRGGDGNDTIQGGNGNEIGRGDGYASNPGDDYLQGNAGDDTLFGDRGNDRMVGGIGNDALVGGFGGEFFVGNGGEDSFVYSTVEESQNVTINGKSQLDQISDFTQGQDKIDLSGIDANPTLDGDQAFTFIADPTHYTGDWTGVVWQTTAANGIVTINVSIDGDADAEMQIYMSHPYQFTANDFIL